MIVTNVGTDTEYVEVGTYGVTEIKDNSVEWENSIDFIYEIFGEDEKLLRQIINCPVDIKYFKAGEKE